MTARSTIIERLLGAFWIAVYVFYVLPVWHTTNIAATILLFLGTGVIVYSLAKLLTEKEGMKGHLTIISVVTIALVVLFVATPVNT